MENENPWLEQIRKELLDRENERFNLKMLRPRFKFKLSNGFWYLKIAWIFWVKRNTSDDLVKDDAFYELSAAIFWEDNENVKKLKQEIESKNPWLEQIRKELLEREEERFKLKSTDLRLKFKLSNGFWYLKIAWNFWVKRNTSYDLVKDDAFYELSAAIFWEDNEDVKKILKSQEIFQEEIRQELTEGENERFNLKTQKPRSKFKLSNWIWYFKIAWIFWVERNTWNDLLKDDAFYELSAAIFWENHQKVIELKERLKLQLNLNLKK